MNPSGSDVAFAFTFVQVQTNPKVEFCEQYFTATSLDPPYIDLGYGELLSFACFTSK